MNARQVNLVLFVVAGLFVVQSVGSSIGYDNSKLDCSHPLSPVRCYDNDISTSDNYEQIPTLASSDDSHSVQTSSDKEYLIKKTSNLVDLFYETGIPKRIAKFLRKSETEMASKEGETLMKDVESIFEGRKKDKGGLGAALMMGMMMAKMLGALGVAGVGALAAKALGVSMMALLLSAIVGLKKLSEGGHGDGHGDHHRKRRDLADDILPYFGWTKEE